MSEAQVIKVAVKKDHLDAVSNGKPLSSLSELIWNSLDADANKVSIFYPSGEMGVNEIIVRDNGHGMHHEEALELFSSLGGSWKKSALLTKGEKRYLHGQEGKGRFKAFSLGRVVTWHVIYKKENTFWEYHIEGKAENMEYFSITKPKKTTKKQTGVEVKVTELHRQFKLLDADYCNKYLIPVFAIYLTSYSKVMIEVQGEQLQVKESIFRKNSYPLESVEYEGESFEYNIEIIEWVDIAEKEYHFCNAHGLPLHRYEKQIRGTGDYHYSAYLKSEHIAKLNQKGLLSLADLEPSLREVIDGSIQQIKHHFKNRMLEDASTTVEKWKEEEIYPYKTDPVDVVGEAERTVFDIVALNVVENLPNFESSESKSKAFQFRMLRQALENSPDELQTIVSEVLQLTKEKQLELAELIHETSLDSIITASKVITDRLKFLSGLEEIIFHSDYKKTLKERTQLHRILAKNTWIFGDAFTLSVDDQSLTEVLKKHSKYIGSEIPINEPVKRIDDKVGIVDLMLSRTIPRNHPNEREHLVVELKAPSVKIGKKEIGQIEDYAFAVAEDERFRHLETRWNFCVISNDIDKHGKRKRNQKDYSDGVIYKSNGAEGEDITISIETWSEVIQECKHRMEFVREHLNYNMSSESGLAYLKEKYSEYVEGVIPELEEVS